MFLVHGWLFVACYYAITPTDYPSTTRGTSAGPPVAVNIDFCGYIQFLSISFVWIIWVQYASEPFWSTTRVCYIGQCLYFNPQWTAGPAINKASCHSNSITNWENCAVAVSKYESGFLEVEGVHSGYTEKPCPSWVQQLTKTAVFQIGVNRIPPNFDKLFATSLEVVRLFKGLSARHLYKSFGIKGLRVIRSHPCSKWLW